MKDTEYTVLTGVKAQRDAKGHVTGLTYTAQKIKDTNTDTKNTAGAKNDAGKLYLIGAKEQTDNPQTYSQTNAYMTDGTLTADALSTNVITTHRLDSNLRLKVSDSSDGLHDVANFAYSNPGGAYIDVQGHLVLNEAGDHVNKPENKTGLNYMSCADYFDTGIAVIGKRTSSDLPSIIRLSFPENGGTIALTSDLSTLLDKGTSSTSSVDFQTVYNPVTFMNSTTTPSINGIYTSVGAVGFPWELGGTTSTSSVSSALTLRGYEDSLKKECYTILTQDGNEFSIKAKNDSMSSILSYNGQWRIGGNQIVTVNMMPRAQQWKLTSTSGTVTTVNICTM